MTTQRLRDVRFESAFRGVGGSPAYGRQVSFFTQSGPESALVYDEVATEQDFRWDCDAQRSGGLGIHDYLELRRLLDR